MIKKISTLIPHLQQLCGIPVSTVSNQTEGFEIAQRLLQKITTTQTVLYLSGGRTPKDLYHSLSERGSLTPGAIGLVDERYGKKWHETSNELMIKESQLLEYLEKKQSPFYPILTDSLSREATANQYDKTVKELQKTFVQKIAILGIGLDGHTAGIPADKKKDPGFVTDDPELYSVTNPRLVTSYSDPNGMYKERITMTFSALTQMDMLLILVFGHDKKDALQKMCSTGSLEEVPSHFFTLPDIAEKTLLITDQIM